MSEPIAGRTPSSSRQSGAKVNKRPDLKAEIVLKIAKENVRPIVQKEIDAENRTRGLHFGGTMTGQPNAPMTAERCNGVLGPPVAGWMQCILPMGHDGDCDDGWYTKQELDNAIASAQSEREKRLREALTKLRNEVHGSLTVFGGQIRVAVGNTNYAVLELRLKEAETALVEKGKL